MVLAFRVCGRKSKESWPFLLFFSFTLISTTLTQEHPVFSQCLLISDIPNYSQLFPYALCFQLTSLLQCCTSSCLFTALSFKQHIIEPYSVPIWTLSVCKWSYVVHGKCNLSLGTVGFNCHHAIFLLFLSCSFHCFAFEVLV